MQPLSPPATPRLTPRLTPLALAACCLLGAPAVQAQAADPDPAAGAAAVPGAAALQPSRSLQPLPRGEAARQQPIVLRAQVIAGRPELDALAEGDVELRRSGLVIRADRLSYDAPSDTARAKGNVRIARDGAVYSGPELQLALQRFEGWFLSPSFDLPALGARGRAERLEFLDASRSEATNATYTSCTRDGPGEPAWELQTRRIRLDLDTGEGRAEGAVLRFQGVPILAVPALSFPLAEQRKSGWLPPSLYIDNRSGVELAVPWYWNIAPNRDATITPRVITRRGMGVDGEFRYLQPRNDGALNLSWLPSDRLTNRSRGSVRWLHEGDMPWGDGLRYRVDLLRVSDDDWWKDFPNSNRSLTPRLLPLRASAEQSFGLPWIGGSATAYARLAGWQVLQAPQSGIAAPYQRAPQLGVRLRGAVGGWEYSTETEYNRFTLPGGDVARAGRTGGERVHVLGSLAYPIRSSGTWLVPRLSLNAAAYRTPDGTDGATREASRSIPSFSVDTGMELERRTRAFGRELQQTLEPRLLYVNTPYRAQSQLPNFDSAAKDFNVVSIYSDNPFTGVDRVADTHQLTAGLTTRLVDAETGAEALRLGLVQRVLFRDQRVAPRTDGSPDGPPLTQRFSDALLVGSTSVLPGWNFDAAVQYNPDSSRSVRSIVGARYAPGPFRTVSATYRLARGLNEQVEMAWQWPIGSAAAQAAAVANAQKRSAGGTPGGGSCSGAWYAVGRVNFNLKDSRVTDSVLGLEYDAGCWIARVVAERLSTGRSEATTRVMFQLEFVGLSRIGSNPLKVLKDNIPGYRLLREERSTAARSDDWQPAP